MEPILVKKLVGTRVLAKYLNPCLILLADLLYEDLLSAEEIRKASC